MASIARDADGTCRLVHTVGGKRKYVRLGWMTANLVKALRPRIDAIVAANKARLPLDEETAGWLGNLDPKLYGKLAAAGLVPERQSLGDGTLEGFFSAHLTKLCKQIRKRDGQPKLKQSTRDHLDRAKRNIIECFGAGRMLWSVSPHDADQFREHLKDVKKMAENTVRRTCERAKQFFRAAVRAGLIRSNPFGEMEDLTVGANPDREFYVTPTIAKAVLDKCPTTRCQLIFTLARWGGLRCPSEVVRLRWGDIDWEKYEFTIHSPKTEHHEGKDNRATYGPAGCQFR